MKENHVAVVQELLESHHRYDDDLSDKAIHKLTYLVQKRAEENGLDLAIPHFWYRYGVLTYQPPSVFNTKSPQTTPGINETKLENIVDTVLDQYYSTSLEDLTDFTYDDAPYDVFHSWRDLDKKIRTLHEEHPDFYSDSPTRHDILTDIETVFDTFPVREFPELEADLLIWYHSMVGETEAGIPDVDRLYDINTTFWGLFSLRVAQLHRHNMTENDVLLALGLSSLDEATQSRRAELRRLERQSLNNQFNDGNSTVSETTDEMIEPILNSP